MNDSSNTSTCDFLLRHCCWCPCRYSLILLLVVSGISSSLAEAPTAVSSFRENVQPILEQYCYDCHGDGSAEGGVAFDELSSDTEDRKKIWLAVLDNVRSGLMPPPNEVDAADRPAKVEIEKLVHWIKFQAFAIDPKNPDPGRVVPRRLNRVEYQNTIRDLMGYEFRADREFPPDDTGGGFDNNSDVLTLSTLLMEKYLAAAESIVRETVPESNPEPTKKNGSKRIRKRYQRFFPNRTPPTDAKTRDRYAAEILGEFTQNAFRRPAEQEKVAQLVELARSVYSEPNNSFEHGIGRAMMAVLASPHFLFRVDTPVANNANDEFALLDEYSLASRLSYFLWSSMPDRELFDLAKEGRLRAELPNQVRRMLQDSKVQTGLVSNFTGQWLRTRDIDSVEINGKAILGKGKADGNRKTKYDFDGKIRAAMRQETEGYFAHVLKEDRSILEFIDSDYAFLNERLAKQYDIANVEGKEFRLVKLPVDSYRGGVLTHGSVLAVTSNPTRTSPVKRGVFILENILGTPPPPPPPNVADLELAINEADKEEPTLRQALALHRENAVCSSCHDRMDPIGLAFENFIPMGNWRDQEAGQPIVASGQLITGEEFRDVRDLKRILANERRTDFYRCISKKILTYAIGRGLDYRDTHTIDLMVDRIVEDKGRFSTLIMAAVESPPFQQQRRTSPSHTSHSK